MLLSLYGADQEGGGGRRGPREVLLRLRQGNLSYVAGRQDVSQVTAARRAALAAAQQPHAVVLTCSDSRVPPEYIFNEGLGALFVIRVAGAVADPVTVGSVEYGVEHLHAPLIVVMGHTRCGAVKAAIETPAPAGPGANLESILSLIRPGLNKAATHGDAWTTGVYGSVEQTVEDLMRNSKVVPGMGRAGEIGVVGAVYDIESGKVSFSEMLKAENMAGGTARCVEWKAEPRVASAGR